MEALYAHASAHHGVVSRAEARQLGLSRGQFDNLARKGVLRRVAPRVFVIAGSPESWHQRARVAALAVEGLVSHTAAAAVHEIDGFAPRRIEVSAGKNQRPTKFPEQLHRSTQMRFADATVVAGLPVTGLERTVLDLAAVVPYSRFERSVDAVLRQGLCDWPDLYSVLAIHSIQGRNGCGPLRRILDARYGDTTIPDSGFNRMVVQLLERMGLPSPAIEHEILDHRGRFVARVDLAYPASWLAIELDSVRWHLNRESFEQDPRRKNALILLGWTVLTFTWSDYIDQPGALVRSVSSALQQAA